MKQLFLGIVVAGIVVACSSEDPAQTAEADVVNVSIGGANGFVFEPAQVRIKVGQTIRWTWMGGGEHNVVSGDNCTQDDKFPRSGAPQGGGTYERKFDVAGTFPYFCEPHCSMGMKGEVIVE
ncbi:MAG: hypothetical protein KIT84_25255 [Labilithrix sp.]|nr:hypothetical protein [Labilithrix sp.]MCW5814360.1 hypothetical protein [Labilithrix sp.]